jgi:NAD(P)-dependent dehydrogenase (short-subunit alcohol dehydrogenase family)
MNLDLTGKVVLITGGSKGIGLACARVFRAEGARLAIASRSRHNIDVACVELATAFGVAADLSHAGQAATMVDAVEAELGPIDILVNSAGAARRAPPADLTPEFWRVAMDAKYFSYINVIDPVVKRMAARGTGVIVNIIGQGGKVASPVHLAGGSANAALMLATAGLATAYARHGVRVVGINPGLTDTDRVAEGLKADAALAGLTVDAVLAKAVERIPLGRMASGEDIGNLAAGRPRSETPSPRGRTACGSSP